MVNRYAHNVELQARISMVRTGSPPTSATSGAQCNLALMYANGTGVPPETWALRSHSQQTIMRRVWGGTAPRNVGDTWKDV